MGDSIPSGSFIPQQQSSFTKLKQKISFLLLRFGGSKILGVIAIMAVFAALPLTVSTLQQRQDVRQRASGGTQPCATDANSIRAYLAPLNANGSPLTWCGDPAKYYCRSDTPDGTSTEHTDQVGNESDDNYVKFSVREDWGNRLKTGVIKYNKLKPKSGYYAGPATNAYMRSDAPTWSYGRKADSWGLLQLENSERSDLIRLMQAGQIIVEGVCGETPPPTAVPTAVLPTVAPTAVIPTGSVTPTGTTGTSFPIAVQLTGIGVGTDNDSLGQATITRVTPQTATRNVTLLVFNAAETQVTQVAGTLTYTPSDGLFRGTVTVPSLTNGSYILKVKVASYLIRRVPGIAVVPFSGSLQTIPKLIAGDLNDNNGIDVSDYNFFDTLVKTCGAPSPTPNPSVSECKKADLNDDGQRNSEDYKLIYLGISTRAGD